MPRNGAVGATYVDSTFGYTFEKVFHHPVFGTGWVRQHHLRWYEHTGQRVPRGYILHHKDEDKQNNDWENLQLVTRKHHPALHTGQKRSVISKVTMSAAAKARCTPEWCKAVSDRVKKQRAEDKFGRKSKRCT